MWKFELKTHPQLYAEETDYFIKTYNEDDRREFFVRTKCGGWFSIGFGFDGRLDIDGQLYKTYCNL